MKNTLLILGALVLIGLVLTTVWSLEPEVEKNDAVADQYPDTGGKESVAVQENVSPMISTKTYRNDEFGFEFEYPENWELKESTFRNPRSFYNLVAIKMDGANTILDNFFVNVVTPDFADNVYRNLGVMESTTTPFTIGGVSATKYEYSQPVITVGVDIPQEGYHILMGAPKRYEQQFNEILISFKFSE